MQSRNKQRLLQESLSQWRRNLHNSATMHGHILTGVYHTTTTQVGSMAAERIFGG